MLRTALKPRWLALLVLALALATGMAWLGQWQLDRARENGRQAAVRAATGRPAVPLTSLLAPRQTFTNADADRPITARGRWDREHQLLVADRYLNGVRGWWVLTPLVVEAGPGGGTGGGAGGGTGGGSGGGTGGGSGAVAVVRGWVPSDADPAAAPGLLPAGDIDVEGVLRPGEPPVDREPGVGTGLSEGQLDGVDLTQLVQRWPQKLYAGYVVLTAARPGQDGAAPRLVPPTAPSNKAVAWQNLSYAVQWFVFAGFLLLLWFRLVRDDHLGRLHPAATPTAAPEENAGPTDVRPTCGPTSGSTSGSTH